MFIYLSLIIIILLLSIEKNKSMTKWDIVIFAILICISGFRYSVGTDYFGYVYYFEEINTGFNISVEPGFALLNILIYQMGLNSQALFFTISIITMIFFYKGLKYYSHVIYFYKPLVYIIFIAFVYFYSFNGIRQALAAAIIFYATKYIPEKNFIKYIIWILIAMQFHLSSIVFILVYLVVGKSYKKSTMLLILIISFIMVRLGMISNLLLFINNNLNFLDFGGYLENYLFNDYNQRKVSYGVVFYLNILILILFIILKDKFIRNTSEKIILNLFFIYNLMGILSMETPVLTRITQYFTIYMSLCIPLFIQVFDSKTKLLSKYTILMLYILLYLYIILSGYLNPGSADFIPYNYNLNLFN